MKSIRDLEDREKEFIGLITELSELPLEYATMLALWLAIQKESGFKDWPKLRHESAVETVAIRNNYSSDEQIIGEIK